MEDTQLPFSYQINTRFSKYLHAVVPSQMGCQKHPHLDQLYFQIRIFLGVTWEGLRLLQLLMHFTHTKR